MSEERSPQQLQLDRMRRIALGLLIAMAALLVLARVMQSASGSSQVPWSYVAAFSEAALVGGMADWFAVTALFRHPLGLKIPHTAIIPNNKERIGESIGHFLQFNFMTQEVLRRELSQVDFAGAATAWLADEGNRSAVAQQLARALPSCLRATDDQAVREFMRIALAGAVDGVRLAPAMARVLELLVAGRQHHLLLERILGIVARALEQNRPYIRQKVHENSPRWLPRAIDERLFERILEGVQAILIDIQAEDSEWRARFDQAVNDMIGKVASSSEYELKLHDVLARGLHSEPFQSYSGEVWKHIKERLLADSNSPAPVIAARTSIVLQALGAALSSDSATRARLNAWLRAIVADTIVDRRDVIASVVWRVIRTWDAETVSRKFELQVGKDLQFIRINGTIVGGAVGVLVHAVSGVIAGAS